jgi:hypothetical protein
VNNPAVAGIDPDIELFPKSGLIWEKCALALKG